MKIFYAASRGGSDESIGELAADTIPTLLREMGHEVQVSLYDPENPSSNGGFDATAEGIVAAEVFIGEMSRASQTLGFQLSYALHNTKPSLYLYNAVTKAKPGTVLTNNPSRLLKVKSYDKSSVKHVLDDFVNYAASQLNSVRTSFMSTRRIDQFVSDRANLLGIKKAEVIRQILDEAIDR